MQETENVKMGLTEEDVQKRAEGPGIAGLFTAMGDSEADGEAIAESEDGKKIEERMAVMGMGEDSKEGKEYWACYEKGDSWRRTGKVGQLCAAGSRKGTGASFPIDLLPPWSA